MNDKHHKVLSVIIPVYNEEKTVAVLLDKVLHASVPVTMEIIVVNDGSTDRTPEICREWLGRNRNATGHRLMLLDRENGGKGAAVKTGIRASTGDVIIIQDGDLEYDPEDFTRCITPILHGECKVVYGSREADNRNRMFSTPSFFLGGLLLTWWVDLLFNAELTDEPTCYKTFDGPLLRSIPIEGDKFDWEPEITAKLLRLGFEIREVPVSYHPRSILEGKKIKWRDGLISLWVALFWRFAPMRRIRDRLTEPELKETVRRSRFHAAMIWLVFLIAFLIRLLGAIPGLNSPQLLMRPDSAPFLADAGRGIFTEAPSFHKPYPSGWRKTDPQQPEFRRIYGNETRAPLYPVWLSLVFGVSGHSLPFAAVMGCLLGAAACLPLLLSGHLFGSPRIGLAAGLLLALNPTAIVFSPLFLPDTLFLLIAALQVWFFLRFVKNCFGLNLIVSVMFAALGALIRPVNAFWIVPCIFVLIFLRRMPLRLRFNYMLTALVLFALILFPWLLASKLAKIGWRIDTISSEALLKNAAAVEARATGGKASDIAAGYRAEMYELYAAEPEKYRTLEAQLAERDRRMFAKLARHPFHWIASHFDPEILRQDLEGLFINLGIFRRPEQFWLRLLYVSTVVLYLFTVVGLGWFFIAAIDRRSWIPFLLFLLLAGYYLLMPGSIAEPRYQLPALPFLCLAAAFGLVYFHGIIKEKKTPAGIE
ncbi:MAG: glycosyltransferase [Lentisphaeria bacterium]|nr:glycosyltransferase [Lentisphaeria bacterium]